MANEAQTDIVMSEALDQLTVYLALSAQQEQRMGNRLLLPCSMFGNGSSIPFKFCCHDAVKNAEEYSPGFQVVAVYQVKIQQHVLVDAMRRGKVDVGCWGNRPGLRWKEDFRLNGEVDFMFNWPPEGTVARTSQPPAIGDLI